MANTPLVTCRAVLFETAYYHYFFVSLLLFFYFYYFDFLSRFRVGSGWVPGGSGWFRLGSGRFRAVPGGSGRFRVGSAFYIHHGFPTFYCDRIAQQNRRNKENCVKKICSCRAPTRPKFSHFSLRVQTGNPWVQGLEN